MNLIFQSVFAGLLLCVEGAEAATITTLAGTGAPGSSGDGGPALEALFPQEISSSLSRSFLRDSSENTRFKAGLTSVGDKSTGC